MYIARNILKFQWHSAIIIIIISENFQTNLKMYVEATRCLVQAQILHRSQNYLNTFANHLVNYTVDILLLPYLILFISSSHSSHFQSFYSLSSLFSLYNFKGKRLYRTSRLDELSRIAYCVLYKSCRRFQKKYYTDAKEKRGFTGSAEKSEFTFA